MMTSFATSSSICNEKKKRIIWQLSNTVKRLRVVKMVKYSLHHNLWWNDLTDHTNRTVRENDLQIVNKVFLRGFGNESVSD